MSAGPGRFLSPGAQEMRGTLGRLSRTPCRAVGKTNVREGAEDATRQGGETSGGGRSPANWSSLLHRGLEGLVVLVRRGAAGPPSFFLGALNYNGHLACVPGCAAWVLRRLGAPISSHSRLAPAGSAGAWDLSPFVPGRSRRGHWRLGSKPIPVWRTPPGNLVRLWRPLGRCNGNLLRM